MIQDCLKDDSRQLQRQLRKFCRDDLPRWFADKIHQDDLYRDNLQRWFTEKIPWEDSLK